MTVVSITIIINYDSYDNYQEFILLLCIINAKQLDKNNKEQT